MLATADGKEIEARRRSALDKNFMRFGRAYPNPHMLYHMAVAGAGSAGENSKAFEGGESMKRNGPKETRTTTKGGNLMRFGRSGNNFLRFGRNMPVEDTMEDQLLERPQTRASNSFLRFGRNFHSPVVDPVFVPAEAIWPLMQQQQQFGQVEEYTEEDPDTLLEQ